MIVPAITQALRCCQGNRVMVTEVYFWKVMIVQGIMLFKMSITRN